MAKNDILIECKMRIKNPSLKTQIENEKGPLKVGNWECDIGLWKISWDDLQDARNAGGPEPVERRHVGVPATPVGAEPGLHAQGAAAGSESAGAQPGDHCVRVRIYIFKHEKWELALRWEFLWKKKWELALRWECLWKKNENHFSGLSEKIENQKKSILIKV